MRMLKHLIRMPRTAGVFYLKMIMQEAREAEEKDQRSKSPMAEEPMSLSRLEKQVEEI